LDRRLAILKKEGIRFETGVKVGVDYSLKKLNKYFDACCLAGGSRVPRDLPIEGRSLKNIHFAMDYLTQANKISGGARAPREHSECIDARGKRVVVLGGGDTGADCVGTAHRQGASCVVQIELMPQPPECRTYEYPWPLYPLLLKTSSSHQEGGERRWSILTKKFIGEAGAVKKLSCVKVEFVPDASKGARAHKCPIMREISGTAFEIPADLVILALGFVHPEHNGLLKALGVALDERGNVKTGPDYHTSARNVFSAGDMRRGQSLIVWAIAEGRRAAYSIDTHLTGGSTLPRL